MDIYKDDLVNEKKEDNINENYKNEDNYVFIDEKYKKFFDEISDIFEEKIEFILNKHFKKNEPKNKNKLLCLNLCILWQKKFLLNLSKSLNEYETFKQINNKTKDEIVDNKENTQDKDTEENAIEEKDLKSYIKNVKVVDNKNIEVIYEINELNDNRASAILSTDEIYYLLVESKKSENEYKKKIYTFLKCLPLIIKCLENKSYIEKKCLEEKLFYNDINNLEINDYKNDEMKVTDINVNDMVNINMNVNCNDLNNTDIKKENVDMNINDLNENKVLNLSTEEIKDKLNAIVQFNYNLSENLEHLFINNINGNVNNFVDNLNNVNVNTINNNQMENFHNFNINENNEKNKESNEKNNLSSLVLPLSKVNDLSLLNNMNTKNNVAQDENNKENSFYIYNDKIENTNLYGLDILINVNNNLIYKINHIYSLIQFYTMLAKDIFDET